MRLIIAALITTALLADSVAGIRWTAPPAWQKQPARPMRAATYTVPPAAGDKEGGECVAYYFGKGQGGNVEMNILRWKGQFFGADGKVAPAKTAETTVHGLKVTTIDTQGEYTGMAGPMAKEQVRKSSYRLLGAIVEAPDALVFFKLTGPLKTVEANQQTFRKVIDSFQKGV